MTGLSYSRLLGSRSWLGRCNAGDAMKDLDWHLFDLVWGGDFIILLKMEAQMHFSLVSQEGVVVFCAVG